jgi:hypothetical protein
MNNPVTLPQNYDTVMDSLTSECPQKAVRHFTLSLVIGNDKGQRVNTTPVPVKVCCVGAAARLGWERLGPTVCACAPDELKLEGVLVRS